MKKNYQFNWGSLSIEYFITDDSIEWMIIPIEQKKNVHLPKKIKKDSLVQVKLIGDAYPKGFVTGSTMRNSETVKSLRFVRQEFNSTMDNPQIVTVLVDKRGNQYRHFAIWHKPYDVVETFVQFTNFSDSPEELEMISSFSLSNLSPFNEKNRIGNLSMTRYRSKWSFEGRKLKQPIEDLQLEPSWKPSGVGIEKYGQLGSMPVRGWFPYIAIEDASQNVSWSVTLAQPGSWQIEAYRLDEDLCLSGGLADRDFGHWKKKIQPMESFQTPSAYITTAIGNEEKVSQKLFSFLQTGIDVNDHQIESSLPIQFNEFCTTWGNPSEASIVQTLNVLKNRGVLYYVIDAGWYANENNQWENNHGDWLINTNQFPNGMEKVIQLIKKNGMIPGIWFEFETVGEDSIAFSYVDHLLKKDGFPLTIGKRRFWDMNDPWVIDYLEKKIIDFLQKYAFGYLKIDYNETIGIGADGAESYGEKLRQQLAGTQAFIQKIKNRLPDLIIESCSSGGHRLEPSMMSLSDLSSFSDAHEADSIPIIAANLHHLLLPRQSLIWAVLRENDSQQRLYYSLISTFLGRMCLSGDIEKLSDIQWKIVDQAIQFYKSIVPIIKYGITERLGNLPLSYQRMSGHQILKRQREEKLLVVIHFFDEMEVFVPTSFQTIVASFGLEDQKMSLKRTEKGFFIVSPYQMTACALLLKK